MVLDSLKIVPFSQDRVPNDFPGGDLPWQMYHTVRNALVETCRIHGPTGPMGVVNIEPDVNNPYIMLAEDLEFWEDGDPDPWYFIIDDQYNDERYCYAELHGDEPLNAAWLLSITTTLRRFSGWGLGINNIWKSYLLIFGDRLMVKGRLAKCTTADEVVALGSKLFKRGDREWWHFWKP